MIPDALAFRHVKAAVRAAQHGLDVRFCVRVCVTSSPAAHGRNLYASAIAGVAPLSRCRQTCQGAPDEGKHPGADQKQEDQQENDEFDEKHVENATMTAQ